MRNTSIQTGDINSGGYVSIGNTTQNNFYKSIEWKDLENKRKKIQEQINTCRKNIEKYPEDDDFRKESAKREQEYHACLDEIQQFQNEVTQLAEKFRQIKIDNERLKKAYEAFQNGEYSKARTILDTEESLQEHNNLLEQRTKLQQETAKHNELSKKKAKEWVLSAHLNAIDYSKGDERINNAKKLFERAMEVDSTPASSIEYAQFLSHNNDLQKAEEIYTNTLKKCEILVSENQKDNLMYLTLCLGGFAILLNKYAHRWNDAEHYYRRAIEAFNQIENKTKKHIYIYIQLLVSFANLLDLCYRHSEAKSLYDKCLIKMDEIHMPDNILRASVYSDLGLMLKNIGQFEESKYFLLKSLKIQKIFVKEDSKILIHLISTLNILGNLLCSNIKKESDSKEAQKYYQESLENLNTLIKRDGSIHKKLEMEIYASYATFLNDIWEKDRTKGDIQQIEKYYKKAISSYQYLNILNPNVDKQHFGLILQNYGTFKSALNKIVDAENLYKKSLEILEEINKNISKENNIGIQDLITLTLTNLGNLYRSKTDNGYLKAKDFYERALDIQIILTQKSSTYPLETLFFLIKNIDLFLKLSKQQNIEIDNQFIKKHKQAINLLTKSINTKKAI
ncbi:tetratricopeptide repeat protein [Neisseria zalophi]|uniref:Tetratricopeptide repeat protein n=1 Tax=Neisseria zalophi TaxID=640030 RepID=A0A5J6PU71_9NEIS|nr:tetratricopeptide repeat protein [Neisseria zalophi]QEY25906.1 tetratricopeptide repeat protein [Neisseria zalophi]